MKLKKERKEDVGLQTQSAYLQGRGYIRRGGHVPKSSSGSQPEKTKDNDVATRGVDAAGQCFKNSMI